MRYAKWPDDQINELRQRWWNGERLAAIGRAMKRDPSTVRKCVERYGMQRNPHGWKRPTPMPPEFSSPANVQIPRADGSLVTILTVKRDECRWIDAHNHLSTAAMCGRKIAKGEKVYCSMHARIAHG